MISIEQSKMPNIACVEASWCIGIKPVLTIPEPFIMSNLMPNTLCFVTPITSFISPPKSTSMKISCHSIRQGKVCALLVAI